MTTGLDRVLTGMTWMTDSADRERRLVELRSALAGAGKLRERELRLPESGRVYEIIMPDGIDPLLDAVVDDPEQNLPYWSQIWSSGVALADAILANPDLLNGQPVIEIGCGLGITAVAAVQAGAELTVTDYAPLSLTLARYNVLANTGSEPDAAVEFNWRSPGDEFLAATAQGYPIVLAADVLYESRDVEPLLRLLEQVVVPGGLLWLAEPGRAVAGRFVDLAVKHGWRFEHQSRHDGPWPDREDAGIKVTVHRLRRSST